MPELPEVETVRRQLEPALTGRTVTAVHVPSAHRHVHAPDLAVGRTVASVGRHGKIILAPLEPSGGEADALPDGPLPDVAGDRLTLVLHLGMSGRVVLTSPSAAAGDPAHLRVRLTFDDGSGLMFIDPRRFGRFLVTPYGSWPTLPLLSRIGPDLLEVDLKTFSERIRRTGRPVKAALLDQTVVAGVGNIYADEAMWAAGIDPSRPAASLNDGEASLLHSRLTGIVLRSVEVGGTTFRDHRDTTGAPGGFAAMLQVYGRAGLPCPGCGAALARSDVAGRTTVSCAACQS